MSPYRVVVRNSPDWRRHKAATLGVSVPSHNWQSDKFEAILQFADRHCDLIRIDVTDALYRHNFMAEGLDPDIALARANAMGALWLAQHQDIIADSTSQIQIVRWAEWYNHAQFNEVLHCFKAIFDTNENFRALVMKDVMAFYHRKGVSPTQAEIQGGINYLIEELTVITLQARELPSLKIYPGDELNCFKAVRKGQIAGAPFGLELEQFAKIKFEKYQPAVAISAQSSLCSKIYSSQLASKAA